jgi:glycosyltransferase involved in cell wall biosynthesis
MRVSLITLGDPSRVTGGYLYHRRMAAAAPRYDASLEFVSFPDRRWPLPAAGGLGVSARVRAQVPDVVVIDSIAAAYAAPWLRQWKFPLSAIVHQPPGGIGNTRFRTKVQAALDGAAYRRTGLIMAASATLGTELAERGVPDRKIRVIPPGRDVADRGPGPLPDLRAGRRVALLCVGSWFPAKGITDLLDAVVRLPSDLLTLHLVGDDRVDARYGLRVRRRLRTSSLRDRVVVHGPISAREVARLYAAADAFVLPSAKESYGTVYGEALAAGLPVVGWDAGNLPHLATDGVEGFVVPPGDIEGLATALGIISSDDAMRARMSSAAATRASALPTWEDTSRAFFGALRELLGATKK